MAGLTFMMVMSNSIVASYILSKKKNERKVIVIAGAILIAIIFISLLYGAINLKNDVSGDVSVAVVQPNFPNDVEWRKKHVEEIFKVYEELILKAKEADIIVLPQYTWPVSVSTTSRILKNLSRITDSYITIGTYRGYVNIAILFSKEGELVGEYVAVNKPPFRNQTPGHEYVVLDSGMGNLGMLLCYDTTDEKIAREFVRNDAQVLVSMANDNVFLGTTEPEQHLEQDILRAVENRRYIVRAAPSGISAIIDPYGRIVNRSEIGKRQVLFGSVKLMNEKTIFTQIGHIFSPLALVALLVMYVMRRK